MKFRTFGIDGPVEIVPRKIEDERGYFSEIFREKDFAEHVGNVAFVQANQSLSVAAGTVRGIHFQIRPAAQGKLVRCIAGKVFDVAVDLRSDSKQFGNWVSTVLSSDEINQLWIPPGFGHAFCTLEPNCVIGYQVTDYYSAASDKGVAWNDPSIGIDWPKIANPDTLSAKDRLQPTLSQLPQYFSTRD